MQQLIKKYFGSVTTEKQGLPADEADKYLAKGYSRNDRVGQSYLKNNMKMSYKVQKHNTK